MSNHARKSLVFRNKAAANRAAASYRKQFGLQLDGLPRLGQLTKEVFSLVEVDQGKGFVAQSSASNFGSKAQFFAVVRGWEAHSRRAANNLRSFLAKYDQL